MNHPIDQYPLITHACYSTKETQANSYQLGYESEWHNIEGDIVECGIAGGGNFAFMMLGCLSANPSTSKTFWGYDPFRSYCHGIEFRSIPSCSVQLKHPR